MRSLRVSRHRTIYATSAHSVDSLACRFVRETGSRFGAAYLASNADSTSDSFCRRKSIYVNNGLRCCQICVWLAERFPELAPARPEPPRLPPLSQAYQGRGDRTHTCRCHRDRQRLARSSLVPQARPPMSDACRSLLLAAASFSRAPDGTRCGARPRTKHSQTPDLDALCISHLPEYRVSKHPRLFLMPFPGRTRCRRSHRVFPRGCCLLWSPSRAATCGARFRPRACSWSSPTQTGRRAERIVSALAGRVCAGLLLSQVSVCRLR